MIRNRADAKCKDCALFHCSRSSITGIVALTRQALQYACEHRLTSFAVGAPIPARRFASPRGISIDSSQCLASRARSIPRPGVALEVSSTAHAKPVAATPRSAHPFVSSASSPRLEYFAALGSLIHIERASAYLKIGRDRRLNCVRSGRIRKKSAYTISVAGAISGSNKAETALMCRPGTKHRETRMQRFVLAVALIATVLFCESSTPAQAQIGIYPADVAACQPFPPSYPRGWELMVRRPCLIYGYYEAPRYYPFAATYAYRPAHRGYPTHRRPYLRPGWWW